jgi:hypothetical protein
VIDEEITPQELSNEEKVAQYESDCDTALRQFWDRTHWEAATDETPLDSVISNEEIQIAKFDSMTDAGLRATLERYGSEATTLHNLPRDLCIELLQVLTKAEIKIQDETMARAFQFFIADGIHPAQVLRRLYALGAHMVISPFCDLNLRERAMMLGESHGAQHWRTQRICVDPLMRKGARAWKAPGQKSLESRAKYAQAAAGNSNRTKNKKGKNHANGNNGTQS